jgi:colanic acid/amylovoran biosynthesis glycosyltransferase
MGIIGAQCMSTGALRGKLVTAFHGYDLTSYLQTYGDHIYDFLFEFCDLCLPISDYWKRKLMELGCPSEKVIVHRMGVDVHQFQTDQTHNQNKNKIKILTIARLVEKKGIKFAIKAMASVVKEFEHFEYWIIGDGPLKAELEEKVIELGLKNYVIFKGWMTQTEIFDTMRNTDVLVAPSITSTNGDQEGIPVVLMEGLMMQLPAISTIHSGIPELIQDGISGFLVPEKNVYSLSRKLLLLIQDSELRSKMGKAGRQFVNEHFNVDKLNDQLVDIYHKLIA